MTTQTAEEAITAANKAWLAHARPIIKAWLLMDEALSLLFCDKIADPTYYKNWAQQSAQLHDWNDASQIIDKARNKLYDMLEGIRDNHRCDYSEGFPDGIDEDEWDRREAWNEELERGLISVETAVKMVENEDV